MKTPLVILFTLAVAVPTTWFVARQSGGSVLSPAAGKTSERKVLYYQSAMHPWIKSDKPGRCTICGMELTPVYEGQKGFETDSNVVSLGQSMIQVLNVATAEAKTRPLEKLLQVAGVIDDNQTRHRVLSAYVDGRIDKLLVNYIGAEVEQGQPLAHLYSPTLITARDEYLLALRQPASPQQERLVQASRERLIRLGLTAEQVAKLPSQKQFPNFLEILAPIGGTVVAQNVYEGQYVKEGEKLLEIADFSTMWFQFRAYEQDMPWIKLGQKVEVTTPSHPGEVFEGKVTFIDPNFDEATRATKVRVELPNPIVDGRRLLLHRLYADGTVYLEAPTTLTVPRSAIVETGPEAVVYVDQGGGAYARNPVKLGRRGDKFVEVISGVAEGDKVVTNGTLLIDGQAEMNRSFVAEESGDAVPPAPPASDAARALTDAQRKAVEVFVASADQIAQALASDDLADFNAVSPNIVPAIDGLTRALHDRPELTESLRKLTDAQHLHDAKDLASARKAFHSFSVAATAVLEPIRKTSGAPAFTLWECPMVDQAVPGVPKKGRWIQVASRKIQNPFFGKEMLECGVPVKP